MSKPILVLLLFLLVFSCLIANAREQKELSEKAVSIRASLEKLRRDLSSETQWKEYLYLFPKTKNEFKDVFDPDDFSELYDGHEYIFELEKAPKEIHESILKLLFSIVSDGVPGCCDAWSALHHVMVGYAIANVQRFVSILTHMESEKRINIIGFLADKENHATFTEYQQLIDEFRKMGKIELAQQFEDARSERMRQEH